jgi:multidrug efflux system membrane fusion protein
MYVYFDVDERTVLRVRRGINEGKIVVPEDRTNIPIFMQLEGEEGFPHEGTLDFINNALTPSTATILARAVFKNPILNVHETSTDAEKGKPKRGRRLLSPGMFVAVRVPIGQPHPGLLVIDRAVGSDQGLKFVYVLDKENKVQYRRVNTGPLQDNGLRVIEGNDLHPEDWVVVSGLQQVRPGMEVEPERLAAMPTLAAPTGGAPAPVPGKPQGPSGSDSKR